ncbi:hypothetical protein KAU09_04335 [Candidatus Parcubacteria bacterium]|nr:hypothetical protein [Candidatus Parcubacteria bacterium]
MFDHLGNKQNGTSGEIHKNNRAEDLKIKKNISRLTGGRLSALADYSENNKKFDERIRSLEKKGKKRGKCFSLIGIIGGFLIALLVMYAVYFLLLEVIDMSGKIDETTASIPDISKSINKKDILPTWKKCELNLDCIVTKKGCCECASGGSQEAINKKYLEEWNSKLNNNCHTVVCPQLYRCEDGRAICDNGLCIFEVGAIEDFIKEETPVEISTSTRKNETLNQATGTEALEGICLDEECLNLLDSDNDGLSDYDENNVYFTNPELSDTDGDGYSDGDEVKNGYDPKEK